ncbi:MAG: L,D-transpeptidase family protein [Pseudolabrys sp.]|nr:L,D-transpeptidase family protein [Pseudolabrys sp.]MDP2296409.1 L,D-transpeptidase family protein [Pseudolabrys sp.]
MIRPLGSSLLALPVIAILSVGAAAQTRDRASERSDPMQTLMGLFQQEAQAQPRDIESGGLPPPGLTAPGGGQTGHQFGNDRGPVQVAPPLTGPQMEALRPPANMGAGPSSAPPPLPQTSVMTLPPDDQPEQGPPKELPANLKKQLVDYSTKEPAGTIIVDTPNTYLYLVLGNGKALRYGIGVGREGFTWAGTERVSRMKEWPDWHPPTEMIERQPYLPRFMAGGNGNPLGARALYLGKTLYRIHGTNQPSTIGQTVSSGCIRLLNEDIEDLFSRVQVGSRVVVMPAKAPDAVANAGPPPPANPMAPPSAAGSSAPTNIAPIPQQGGITGSSLPPAR